MKPCPFCGSDKIIEKNVTVGQGANSPAIECLECGATVVADYIGESAVDKWNKRHD